MTKGVRWAGLLPASLVGFGGWARQAGKFPFFFLIHFFFFFIFLF
jgi:hypothetical protein